jgi:two-component system CheB/CheR fusion protein
MPRPLAGSRQATSKPPRRRGAARRNDAATSRAVSATPHPPGILPFLTIAIGASAGGLHAFTTFLDNLPPDTGMAFVLIQHLDPIHKSLLVSLLAPHTAMPVMEAADGMYLAPSTVFVIPPDATMTIEGGRLLVSSPAPARANRWPIDSFFTSLAADQNQHAVCIVLSGAGSDGSRGLREVKQQGGLVLAQAQDAQAQNEGEAMAGMPYSAVATGLVDHLLAVQAMPAKLLEYQRARLGAPTVPDAAGTPAVDPTRFAEICALLRERIGHDFSQYKKPTLQRRIHRRMQAQGIATVDDLIQVLRREPRQIDRLFHDMLVGVTQFFRDPAAFQMVQDTVLPVILAGKGTADPVRIWIPGCASGEEVYSLAILLKECMDGRAITAKPQIFGTDIDEVAIATARAARYRQPALTRVTPERRAKWFVEDGEFLRPTRDIRDMCVFSVHSVIKDPPFSKLDLISCRNLLIYLGTDLQIRAIRNFHYGLNPGGWLFLGPSEGVGHGTALFDQIDKRHRLFQRREVTAMLPGLQPRDAAPPEVAQPANGTRPAGGQEDALDRSARRALEQYSPAYVVIDRASNIVRFSGGAVGRFLEPSPGVANLGLFGILRKPLRRQVRIAVQAAMADHKAVIEDGLALTLDGRSHLITLMVQPVSDGRTARDRYLVAFIDAGLTRAGVMRARGMHGRAAALPDGAGAAADDDRELALELAATRSQLLANIGDLETANEELRSFNEEYQSANEELQATNEELETAKEEMQSINEELQTVNTELNARNEQLTRLNNDFQNLLDSTQIATIFLDAELRVMRFTPPMTTLFALREADLGRSITEIASRLADADLAADVAAVLAAPHIIEREVALAEDAPGDVTIFLMRVRPYRTLDQRTEGAVITFVDISERKRLQVAAEQSLRALNQTLERRVAERTAELRAANDRLTQQIAERERTEDMLRQAQKLEAVGKLIGGIAHDFNNLLGVIIGNIELMQDAFKQDVPGQDPPGQHAHGHHAPGYHAMADQPELAEQAREILDSALSGAELTRRLLAFARQQPLQPRIVDLNALLPATVTMLRRTLGETIHVTARLAPDLWLTRADPSQIGDALLNLALNARDAMPHGGGLTIETANTHLDMPDTADGSEISQGDYVMLAVGDTGTGMPPEVLERATEPFFTTKPAGAGSGLGLSMIYGFARQSGGHLAIESEMGVGTTVRLYLPQAHNDAAAARAAREAVLPEPGGDEAILLVDDNAILRDATKRRLLALGYQVSTAGSGPAALAILGSGAAFDLLLTDVAMPGMSGFDLAEAARRLQPHLKLLFTTGYARDRPMDADATPEQQPMLRKPYRQAELARAVRTVLDAPPAGHTIDSLSP